jgi:acetone carboxylase beta subunit
MTSSDRKFELCYVDTGGTFTDSFIVDEEGDFVLGKSPTTPHDFSECFFGANKAALKDMDEREVYSQLKVIGYGATTVINAILTRKGLPVGVIVTKGFEQALLMGRGKQTWTGFTITDRIHKRTHYNPDQIVPMKWIRGVTERMDSLGKAVIPLYEEDVYQAAEELLREDINSIVIVYMWSWLNPEHELRSREIVLEVADKVGKEIEVYLSHEVSPKLREVARANTAVIEAYTAGIVKPAYKTIEEKLKEYGYKGALQISQSTGGLTSVEAVKCVDTCLSGPVGGVIGGQYIGEIYGFDNLITTDVGGTSFDVGYVTKGVVSINREPIVARFLLNTSTAEVASIGAGGGTLAQLDPATGRINVGPESAGAVPGPVCYDRGGTVPTVTDADLVLGYIDPDFFLGGRIKLNKDKATESIRKMIAEPLGLGVEDAAEGIREIIDYRMKDAALGMIMARGYDLSNYYLLSFGGAGPTHVAGYTKDVALKGVLAFPYSGVFCAFGAAASNYENHYTKSGLLNVFPDATEEQKREIGRVLSEDWQTLEGRAIDVLLEQGFSRDQVQLMHLAMMKYSRQLEDLVVTSPVDRIESGADLDQLIEAFEEMYSEVYTVAGKYPEAGYEIPEVGIIASVPKVKPKLKKYRLEPKTPESETLKGKRKCYFNKQWLDTPIYNWSLLKAGNAIQGPAILEEATTTLVLPPEWHVEIDEYLTCWLHQK